MMAEITFTERRSLDGTSHFLVPMMDGVEIPYVTTCDIEQQLGAAIITLKILLPDGIRIHRPSGASGNGANG